MSFPDLQRATETHPPPERASQKEREGGEGGRDRERGREREGEEAGEGGWKGGTWDGVEKEEGTGIKRRQGGWDCLCVYVTESDRKKPKNKNERGWNRGLTHLHYKSPLQCTVFNTVTINVQNEAHGFDIFKYSYKWIVCRSFYSKCYRSNSQSHSVAAPPGWSDWFLMDNWLLTVEDSGCLSSRGEGKKKRAPGVCRGAPALWGHLKGHFFSLYLPYAYLRVFFFFTWWEGATAWRIN